MRIITLLKLFIRLSLLVSFVNIASLLFAAELKVNNTATNITLRDVNNIVFRIIGESEANIRKLEKAIKEMKQR